MGVFTLYCGHINDFLLTPRARYCTYERVQRLQSMQDIVVLGFLLFVCEINSLLSGFL